MSESGWCTNYEVAIEEDNKILSKSFAYEFVSNKVLKNEDTEPYSCLACCVVFKGNIASKVIRELFSSYFGLL